MTIGQLVIPEMAFSYVVKNMDFVHIYLVRVIGAFGVGATVSMYLQLESKDPGVSTSILLSRAIGGLIALVAMMIDYNRYQAKFTPAFLSFSILGTALATFGCFVYTFKGSSFGRGNLDFSGRLSCHLLVHAMFSFVWAFYNLGYPDAHFPDGKIQGFRPDAIHFFVVRLMGILGFQFALQNFMALGYQNEKDQRHQILGAIITMVLMFGLMGKFGYDLRGKINVSDPSCSEIVSICVLLFQFCNLLCGYFNLQWPSKLKFKRN